MVKQIPGIGQTLKYITIKTESQEVTLMSLGSPCFYWLKLEIQER